MTKPLAKPKTRRAKPYAARVQTTESGRQGTYHRGIERRAELVQAVLRLIARCGAGAVTHRAVAREAGVSLRATTYYFATKDAMVREALRQFAAENIARADAVADDLTPGKNKLEAAVAAITTVMLAEMSAPDDLLKTEYELILAVSREPTYAPEYQQLQTTLEARLRALRSALGSAEPQQHARLILAATRGLQVEHLSKPNRPLSGRTVRTLVRTLVAALVPECTNATF